MPSKISSAIEQYHRDGFAVIENFLTPEECEEMKQEALKLVLAKEAKMKVKKGIRKNCGDGNVDDSFFDISDDEDANMSGQQRLMKAISSTQFFLEGSAFDKEGNQICPPGHSVSKIGMTLHVNNPVFKKYTFNERVKEVCRQLDYNDPVVIQSIFLFKNPGVGAEIKAHQDGTYLITEPHEDKSFGIWYALDDVTEENGAVHFVPGSHKGPVHRHQIRNPNPKPGEPDLIWEGAQPEFKKDDFVPATCKKGSAVLIHGKVYHYSPANRSNKGRPAYTFHLYDAAELQWSKKNGFQPDQTHAFKHVYQQ